MNKKNILAPYLMTSFLISWILWGALYFLTAYAGLGIKTPGYYVFFILGGLGPTIAPFIVLPLKLGKKEFAAYLSRVIFRFRSGWISYAAAVVFVVLFFLISYFIRTVLAPPDAAAEAPAPWYMVFAMFPVMIVGGGLEEVGWRGTALKALLGKFSPLPAVLILSTVWMTWHVPLFFIPGSNQTAMHFWHFILTGYGISFIISVIFIIGGSAVPCIIAHALYNALLELGMLYPLPGGGREILAGVLELAFGALIFLIITRGGLKKRTKET